MDEQPEIWTEDQVASLNGYQDAGVMHPFTCPNCRHNLVATKCGWTCSNCTKEGKSYTQNWFHAFMGNWKWKEFGLYGE